MADVVRALGPVWRVYQRVKRTLIDRFFERPAGIRTEGSVRLESLGIDAKDREMYTPSPWFLLRRVLARHPMSPDDVLIDFGCGKGRVVFQAARYPFARVIGVELSSDLARIARDNIERAKQQIRAREVTIVNTDVLDYAVPDDVTFVYFNDPFRGEVFAAVVSKLAESVRRRPRTLTIIYYQPQEEQTLLDAGATLVTAFRALRPRREWALARSARVYKYGPVSARG